MINHKCQHEHRKLKINDQSKRTDLQVKSRIKQKTDSYNKLLLKICMTLLWRHKQDKNTGQNQAKKATNKYVQLTTNVSCRFFN